nr:hypothetical protein GCM10017745_35190 [Saccharothrix mutabilis subsp. capreolus]
MRGPGVRVTLAGQLGVQPVHDRPEAREQQQRQLEAEPVGIALAKLDNLVYVLVNHVVEFTP